jgi:hypothetical protein
MYQVLWKCRFNDGKMVMSAGSTRRQHDPNDLPEDWSCHFPPKLTEKDKKVKCTLVQALRLWTGHKAHRGSRGIALLFQDHRH